MYMCVNMLKVETLEATSTEPLESWKNQDPTGDWTQDLLIASQTLLPLELLRIDVYILRLSSHPINDSVFTTYMPRMINMWNSNST